MKTLKTIFLSALLLSALLTSAGAEPLAIVDTHAHLEGNGRDSQFSASLKTMLGEMGKYAIGHTVIMAPPQPPGFRFPFDIDHLRFAPEQAPQQVSLAGGGGVLNPLIHGTDAGRVDEDTKRRFRTRAEELLASGIVAFGEIAAHHVSHARMGPNHPYESVAADHPLLLLLADIAAEKGVPVDLHFDVVPLDMDLPPGGFNPITPQRLAANLPAFERLLAHNRQARIIWAHAGSDPLRTRLPQLCRELLQRHSNLFMSLRVGRGGPHPTFLLDEDKTLKPAWRQLLVDFPERFVVGSDSFFPPFAGHRRTPEEALEFSRALIEQLPASVGQAIASGNAHRLYRLPSAR